MRRREFIKLLGGTATAWPLAARAEQPAIPVIGLLDSRYPGAVEGRLRGFHQGLKEAGYIEGENLAILYRWADDRLDRLPLLAAELVSRSVAAIVTSGTPSALAAKAATTTIPIVFIAGVDPVQLGLAASLSRPDRKIRTARLIALSPWPATRSGTSTRKRFRLDVRWSWARRL